MTNLLEQVVVPSDPSYRIIALPHDDYAIVDSADYDWLNQWKWCASTAGYALRREHYRAIWMHNLILGTSNSKIGDHWNGDTRDNRRCNLRIISQRKNTQNARISRNNSSGCTGVSQDKNTGKWHSYITPRGGKRKTLGYFEKRDDAVAARKSAEKKYYGEVIRASCPTRIVVTKKMLRAAIRANRINNSSGFTGVSRHRGTGKWMARVFTDKTTHYLGLHPSKKLAQAARVEFLEKRGTESPF